MLPAILDPILTTVAVLLFVPIAVLGIEVAVAVFGRRLALPASGARKSVAILVPAHNEEGGIGATLRSLVPQLEQRDRLIVIADNCTDRTPKVAEREGAEVLLRSDLERRGKGFALAFGMRHLRANPPDIVIIVDADCDAAPGSIERLARVCAASERPVQAQYLMRCPEGAPLKTQVAAFAWVLKNLVRPTGLAKLGLPCQLMGSGMAFPWAKVGPLDLANGNIVEDMKLGLDLAGLGSAPTFCPDAVVLSVFPSQEDGIRAQRTRWEHGHLSTILSEAPKLLARGLKNLNMDQVAMALDLCVPPVALLIIQAVLFWFAAVGFYAVTGASSPVLLASSALLMLATTIFLAWVSHGRRIIPFSRLLSAGLYPWSKVSVYLRFIFSRQSQWVRSKRDKES